jgi:hypothetical protein
VAVEHTISSASRRPCAASFTALYNAGLSSASSHLIASGTVARVELPTSGRERCTGDTLQPALPAHTHIPTLYLPRPAAPAQVASRVAGAAGCRGRGAPGTSHGAASRGSLQTALAACRPGRRRVQLAERRGSWCVNAVSSLIRVQARRAGAARGQRPRSNGGQRQRPVAFRRTHARARTRVRPPCVWFAKRCLAPARAHGAGVSSARSPHSGSSL